MQTTELKPVFAVPADFYPDPARLQSLQTELGDKGVQFCLSTYVDVHGVPKAKVNPLSALPKMAAGSELFTVGAMEGMGLVGPQEDECAAVPDLDTAVICPWDKRFAYFFGDLYYHGAPYPNDSRQILKRQLARAREMGWQFNLGLEPEFYVLRTDPQTGQRSILSPRRYLGVCPAYDVYQTLGSMEFLEPMSRYMAELDWGLFSFDQEGGHGQYEFDMKYADALTMSDRMIFLRLMAKRVADSIGAMATFMPKPFANDFRSGCHFNMSLQEIATGLNLFAIEPDSNPLAERHGIPVSKAAFHFIAGVLRHAGAITALTSPTYNSYQGFLAQGDMPDVSWAPVLAAYGKNNRSAMLRVPLNRYCVENRAPDMSANPYLAAALTLAAGLEGIEQELDPGNPLNDNLYKMSRAEMKSAGIRFLPPTLLHAIEALEQDDLAAEILGEMRDIFVKQKTREWEEAFYTVHEKQLSDKLAFV